MKLLLCKNIDRLGIVGEVVNVASGYGRNYLLPRGLATQPTESNVRALAEARKTAELEREHARAELAALAERIKDAEVTIRAKTNEEGVLYGSVGKREIADALANEGYFVKPEQIDLPRPIRHLDNVAVGIVLDSDLRSSIKVWVVRERTGAAGEEEGEESEATAGKEAAGDEHTADE